MSPTCVLDSSDGVLSLVPLPSCCLDCGGGSGGAWCLLPAPPPCGGDGRSTTSLSCGDVLSLIANADISSTILPWPSSSNRLYSYHTTSHHISDSLEA